MSDTYMHKRIGESFDWRAFLAKAASGEVITTREFEHARSRSGGWVTCAVGNQCARLPRNSRGEPEDSALYALGMAFCEYIGARDWPLAILTLDRIEERAARLLAALEIKANE